MIRFRTIEPGKSETPARKPAAAPAAPVAVVETGDAPAETASPIPGSKKGKGMTRKTPMRARKPAVDRTFRD